LSVEGTTINAITRIAPEHFGHTRGSTSYEQRKIETYLAILDVGGLDSDMYRYLPLSHQLVFEFSDDLAVEKTWGLHSSPCIIMRQE